ncbi:MAG TPA: hypothetical protein VGG33_14985, partial [Polyangia bacterium]
MSNRVAAKRQLAGAFALLLASGVAGAAEASTSVTYMTRTVAVALASPGNDTAKRAEIAALQGELAKKTAEISAIKRANRGVRDDYQLRRRMAEANEIARRLTTLEAELRTDDSRAGTTGVAGGPPTQPAPAPASEAASVLAARADLLSDEARKLSQRAAGMVQAAGQLRARQALRRRAFNVERDAFSGLDGARRVLPARPTTASAPGSGSPTGGAAELSGGPQPNTTTSGGPTPTGTTASPPGGMATAPGPSGTGAASPPPTTAPPPSNPVAPPSVAPVSPTPAPPSDTAGRTNDPGNKTNISNPGATGAKAELAPGSLLDPSLRAELARIEAAGAGSSDAEA